MGPRGWRWRQPDGRWSARAAYRQLSCSTTVACSGYALLKGGNVLDEERGSEEGGAALLQSPLGPKHPALQAQHPNTRVLAAVAAAAGGQPLDLSWLAGRRVPPLFYADDCALLATTAQGLQAPLRLPEASSQSAACRSTL